MDAMAGTEQPGGGDTLAAGGDELLTTGWEPHVAADDTVVRQFSMALGSRLEHEAALCDGWTERDDLAVIADVGSAVPFENGVVLLRPPGPGELDRLLERCFDRFPVDRQWVLYSPFALPDLSENGFARVGHPPYMYRPAGGSAPALPDGLEIRSVKSRDDLAAFADVMVRGFGFDLPPGAEVFSPGLLDGGPTLCLGSVDGRPVAGSAGNVVHGINEVAMVATLPEARGHRYGEALTWAATMLDPSLPAGLIASDDGQPVYERMGYLRILRFTLWGVFGSD
jgi:hypothetical protein